MDIQKIVAPVAEDMRAVDVLIQERLQSEVVLIKQLGHYIVNSGGKRLRPLLVLLMARACGYTGEQHIPLAAIIEFIHTATLLHDDVVDASALRRGQETANEVWGNEASVLVGDFLYSRAFEMMVELENINILGILAKATNVIAEGEVLQLLNVHNPDTTESEYLKVIASKTAKLFQAGAQLGGVLGGVSSELQNSLAAYGMHLGTAFQLIDDALDYSADPVELGKNLGDDLAEGKPTLPLIYAIKNTNEQDAEAIRKAIETGGRSQIDTVLNAIHASGAIQYTHSIAERESNSALRMLENLAGSQYKDSLAMLAEFSIQRRY